MKLEWFRQHKKFVYWVLLPVVGLGMAFFGATSALQSARSAKRGPSIEYKVGDSWRTLGPSEVQTLRYVMTQYQRRGQAGSDAVGFHFAALHAATEAGFEVGEEEAREALREEVKARTEQEKVSDVIYHKLLTSLQVTPAQFESLTRENRLQQKMFNYVQGQCKADDPQLFVTYCEEKEIARLRYKDIKSEDFISKVKAPAPEKIKEFYDKNKENVKEFKDVMFTKPKLSADMLFLDTKKLFGEEIKPTEADMKRTYDENKALWKIEPQAGEPAGTVKYKPLAEVKTEVEAKWKEKELKSYYDRYKGQYWKIPPKELPKPNDPPPEETFKPLAEVKAEVELKWKMAQQGQRGMARSRRLGEEAVDAEKAWDREQAAKPEAERKPFDLGAWAEKQGLVHWTTNELTDEQFRAGKRELKAPDAGWAQSLFFMIDNPYLRDEKKKKEMMKEFSSPQITAADAKDQGAVIARVHKYVAEQVMPLEEATSAIVKRLCILDAVDLAREEAKKVRAEWVGGKVPPLDSLEEVMGAQQDTHALLGAFFKSPKPIGDVLEVVDAPAKPNDPRSTDPNKVFSVGFAVERQLPTWNQFHHDLAWSRDDKRRELVQSLGYSTIMALQNEIRQRSHRLGTMEDPPVFDGYRRGGQAPDDDY